MIDRNLVTTAFTLDGYEIVQNLGVVRGITVRTRALPMIILAGLRSLFGGKIGIIVKLCDDARAEAHDILLQHAESLGANAVVGFRYDASSFGMAEFLAYGTACIVRKKDA